MTPDERKAAVEAACKSLTKNVISTTDGMMFRDALLAAEARITELERPPSGDVAIHLERLLEIAAMIRTGVADNEEANGCDAIFAAIASLARENERLKSLDPVKEYIRYGGELRDQVRRAEAAEAEVARLRDALERIEGGTDDYEETRRICHAALAPKKEPNDG